jgi:hypothetical protein
MRPKQHFTFRGIDVILALKGEDSSFETVMPDRENVPGSVGITVVMRAALRAGPVSYSQTFQAFGVCAAVTHAAGLGGVLHTHQPL